MKKKKLWYSLLLAYLCLFLFHIDYAAESKTIKYENKDLGFSFQYPDNWESNFVYKQSDINKIESQTFGYINNGKYNIQIGYDKNKDKDKENLYTFVQENIKGSKTVYSVKKVKVNGIDFYRIKHFVEDVDENLYVLSDYFEVKNDFNISIDCYLDEKSIHESDAKLSEIYKILDSVRLVDGGAK